jgi:hypothetical protein
MVADGRTIDAVMVEQTARVPGVLAGDQINFTQDPNRPIRYIFEIPDRCGDDVESTGHVATVALCGNTIMRNRGEET